MISSGLHSAMLAAATVAVCAGAPSALAQKAVTSLDAAPANGAYKLASASRERARQQGGT